MAAPDRAVLAVLRTVAVVTTAIAAYALVVAAFRPRDLVRSVPGVNVWRTDTVGLVCVIASALCYGALRLVAARGDVRRSAFELLRLVAGYAGAGWAYLAVNSITHPRTRVLRATHLLSFPDEQQLASICLLLLIIGLLGAWVVRPPSS